MIKLYHGSDTEIVKVDLSYYTIKTSENYDSK